MLAAHRAGIRRLVAPYENRRDLVLIPKNVAKEMEFFWVANMDQVIAQVLVFADGEVPPMLELPVPPAEVLPLPEAAAEVLH